MSPWRTTIIVIFLITIKFFSFQNYNKDKDEFHAWTPSIQGINNKPKERKKGQCFQNPNKFSTTVVFCPYYVTSEPQRSSSSHFIPNFTTSLKLSST